MDAAPRTVRSIDPKNPTSVPGGAVAIEKTAGGDFFFTDAAGTRLRQLDSVEATTVLTMGQAGNVSPTPDAVVEVANLNRGRLPVSDDAAGALSVNGAQQTQSRRQVPPAPAAAAAQPQVVPGSPVSQAPDTGPGSGTAVMDAAAIESARADLRTRITRSGLDRSVQNRLTQDVQSRESVAEFSAIELELEQLIQAAAQTNGPTPEILAEERERWKAMMRGNVSGSSLDDGEKDRLLGLLDSVNDSAAIQAVGEQLRAALTRRVAPTAPSTTGPAGAPILPAAAPVAPGAAPLDPALQRLTDAVAATQQQLQALIAQMAAAPRPAAAAAPIQPPPPAMPTAPTFVPSIKAQVPEPLGFVPSNPQPRGAHGIVGQDNLHNWWVKSPNGAHFQYDTPANAIEAARQMNGNGGTVGTGPAAPVVGALSIVGPGGVAGSVDQLIAQSDQARNALNGSIVAPLTAQELAQLADPHLSAGERAVLQGRRDARTRFEQQFMSAENQLAQIRGALARQSAAVMNGAPTPAVAAHVTRANRSIAAILAQEAADYRAKNGRVLGTLQYLVRWQSKAILTGGLVGAGVTTAAVLTGGAGLATAMGAGALSGAARARFDLSSARAILEKKANEAASAGQPQEAIALRTEAAALGSAAALRHAVLTTSIGAVGGAAGFGLMSDSGLGFGRKILGWASSAWASLPIGGQPAATVAAVGAGVNAAPSGQVASGLVTRPRPIVLAPVAGPRPLVAVGGAPRPRLVGAEAWILGKRGELYIPGFGPPQKCGIDVHGRKLLTQLGNGSTILDTITKERSWGTPRCLAALRGQFDVAFGHPSGPSMAGIFVENYQGKTAERAVVPGAVVDTLSTVRGRATTVVPGVDMVPPAPATLAEALGMPRPGISLADTIPADGIRTPEIARGATQVVIGTNSPDSLGRLVARAGIDGYANELLFKGDAPLRGLAGKGRLELIDLIRSVLTRNDSLVKEMFPGHPNPVSLIRSGDITFTTGAKMDMNVFKNPLFTQALLQAVEQWKQGGLPAYVTTEFGGNARTFAETVARLLSESPRPRIIPA